MSQNTCLKTIDPGLLMSQMSAPSSVTLLERSSLERSSLKQPQFLTRLIRASKAAKEVFCNELLEVPERDTGLPKNRSSRLVDFAMAGLGMASIAIMALLN